MMFLSIIICIFFYFLFFLPVSKFMSLGVFCFWGYWFILRVLSIIYMVFEGCLYYLTMGFLKVMALIAVPISGMTYAAFSLGKQLPKASRKFGNYIGLSYIYFKCILKTLKPQDQMPYDMIEKARQVSQQSQALRRELRNTVKRAKEDFQRKQEETLSNFEQKIKIQKIVTPKAEDQSTNSQRSKISQTSGSQVMRELLQIQTKLSEAKKLKKQSRSFYDKI